MLAVDQTNIRLDVVASIESEFDFMSAEYREFFAPKRATAFQAPLWMSMMHARLTAPLHATQHTLTLRNRIDGGLVAVIPFVRQKAKGVSLLMPADFGLCDYNSIVAGRGVLAMIAADAGLLTQINKLVRCCDLLVFRKVREDDFDVGQIFTGSTPTDGENAAYHSVIDDDFDEWRRRTIRRKFSKELGRLQRQTDRELGGYEHRVATNEAEIRKAFTCLRSWRAGRFKDDLLQDDLYFNFYLDYAIAAAETGEAITYVSYIADEPAAVLFGLAGDGEFHAVLIGSDTERFGRSSPGIQIIYQIIKRRYDEGFRLFDMGLGNTGYKSHFRVEETRLRNHTTPYSIRGHAVALIYNYAKPLKNLLKSRVSNVH